VLSVTLPLAMTLSPMSSLASATTADSNESIAVAHELSLVAGDKNGVNHRKTLNTLASTDCFSPLSCSHAQHAPIVHLRSTIQTIPTSHFDTSLFVSTIPSSHTVRAVLLSCCMSRHVHLPVRFVNRSVRFTSLDVTSLARNSYLNHSEELSDSASMPFHVLELGNPNHSQKVSDSSPKDRESAKRPFCPNCSEEVSDLGPLSFLSPVQLTYPNH
jgi:hypothetical protein